jgi:DNA-binding transcriptional LysR family regulator
MDLNRVSAFVRVVHDGSFTAAARALGLPKSSVSRSVAQLEQDLGIRLLHRTTRKLHLTDAGAAFYDRVARALSDIDDATIAASDMQAELRGTVRVTAPVDLGVAILGSVVARFVRKHPNIVIDLALTGRVVDMVAEGFDLAVRVGPLRDSSLIARRIGDLGTSLYASPAYVERRGMPTTLEDLVDHDCVLFRPVLGKNTWRLHGPRGEQREVTVTGAIAVDDMSFVRKALLGGAGVALLPDFLVGRDVQAGKLVRVLGEWTTEGGILHVAYPSARFVPQRVIVFREFLLRALAKVGKQCDVERERMLLGEVKVSG